MTDSSLILPNRLVETTINQPKKRNKTNDRRITPGNLSKEPIFTIITNTNCVNQVCIRIEFCIPIPQSIMPEPGKQKDTTTIAHINEKAPFFFNGKKAPIFKCKLTCIIINRLS